MVSAGSGFSPDEYARRQKAIRERMSQTGLDGLLITNPENIFYLIGLDHMGYFAPQFLLFPVKQPPVLITRAMEWAVVRDQVPNIAHIGYDDGRASAGDAADTTIPPFVTRRLGHRPSPEPSAAVDASIRAIHEAGLDASAIAVDQHSSYLPYGIAEGIFSRTPQVDWQNMGSVVDDVRLIQSEQELAFTRRAARISDEMISAATHEARPGTHLQNIMAGVYDASFRGGGTYPGFVPLVRTDDNLLHEHGTWQDSSLTEDNTLFLEMSGCVHRYHAPIGRLMRFGPRNASVCRANEICQQAQQAAADTLRDGVMAGDVYEAWQDVLNKNGLERYSRHHCGYTVGIGYPPSWSGGGVPMGLRRGSELKLRSGMVFHLMSWLLGSAPGHGFLSDTVVVTENGCDFLTTINRNVLR